MKVRQAAIIAAAVCGAMLAPAALAQSSAARGHFGNSGLRNHDGPRVMMYWQMPIDGGRARPASYGLRLDSAPLHAASFARLPLVDFRVQSRSTTLHMSAIPMLRWADSSDSFGGWDSLTDPKTPGFWIGWSAATLVVLCAAREVICEKNKSSGGGGTYTPPGE